MAQILVHMKVHVLSHASPVFFFFFHSLFDKSLKSYALKKKIIFICIFFNNMHYTPDTYP